MRAGYRGLPTWKRPAKKRRNRRILAVGMIVIAVTLVAPLLIRPATRLLGLFPPFQVGGIEVTGFLYLSPEEVRAMVPVREGDNLLALDPKAIEAEIRLHPRIESARVSRTLGRLHVEIRERRTFLLANAGTLLELDEEGTILSPVERGLMADRPVLTGVPFPTVKPGARVTSARLADVLRLVSYLESPEVGLVSDISEIVSQDAACVVLRTTREQIPIYVDPERVTLAAMRALSATLRDVRDRGRHVLAMDTRYRGQVVVRCAPGDSVGTAPANGA
ncbi:MAG: cell division protein FtsQ/DivIB [Candidatus Eiseniibacteriota bacterium]